MQQPDSSLQRSSMQEHVCACYLQHHWQEKATDQLGKRVKTEKAWEITIADTLRAVQRSVIPLDLPYPANCSGSTLPRARQTAAKLDRACRTVLMMVHTFPPCLTHLSLVVPSIRERVGVPRGAF